MSNHDLFGRKIEFLFDQYSVKEPFTIYFDVPFDDGEDINVGEVELFNLSDATINNIKRGSYVVLNAGYQNDVGAILLGYVRFVSTEWRGVDKVTAVHIIDANDTWMEKRIKRTYKEGIKARQILNDLLPQTGLKIGSVNLPVDKVYKGGKTINGSTIGENIVEVARDCNAKIHINRGKIFIRPKSEGTSIGFVLDKEHGLISSPTRIQKEERLPDGKRAIREGWKVISLLNHKITTDSLLEIKSKTANGIFRVEKGAHISNGSNFYTEMEVYPA